MGLQKANRSECLPETPDESLKQAVVFPSGERVLCWRHTAEAGKLCRDGASPSVSWGAIRSQKLTGISGAGKKQLCSLACVPLGLSLTGNQGQSQMSSGLAWTKQPFC